jgi:putative membrane protein
MHNRKLISVFISAAALAVATSGWAQTTTPTTGTGTASGSTTTEDSAVGTSRTPSTTASSGQTTSDTSAATDSGSGNTNATSTGTTTTGTTRGTTTSMDATTGTTAGSTGRTASLEGTDATFLRKAMEGGREEVQRAQEAMRSAQRAEVRNVASMMLEDHRRANEKLTQLASSKGWDVPAMSPSATAESDQPRTTSGSAGFDDNYIEDEIRHHRETISLYRAQASSGSDPDLRQFASDALPSLEHHLEMLQGSYTSK